jgi:hypothetical protein
VDVSGARGRQGHAPHRLARLQTRGEGEEVRINGLRGVPAPEVAVGDLRDDRVSRRRRTRARVVSPVAEDDGDRLGCAVGVGDGERSGGAVAAAVGRAAQQADLRRSGRTERDRLPLGLDVNASIITRHGTKGELRTLSSSAFRPLNTLWWNTYRSMVRTGARRPSSFRAPTRKAPAELLARHIRRRRAPAPVQGENPLCRAHPGRNHRRIRRHGLRGLEQSVLSPLARRWRPRRPSGRITSL